MLTTIIFTIMFLGCGIAAIWVRYLIACHLVMKRKVKQVAVFGDLMHVVGWDPKEALILMRNLEIRPPRARKRNGGEKRGGTRVIFPLFGQSVFARISLARVETFFELNDLLSLDKVRVNVRATILWKIQNVDAAVNAFFETMRDDPVSQGRDILSNAGYFLHFRSTMIIRNIMSTRKITLPALIKIRESRYQPGEAEQAIEIRDAFYDDTHLDEDSGAILRIRLTRLAENCGLGIEAVTLQIGFPEGVHEALEDVWQASVQPVADVYQSLSKEIDFRSTERLIGTEAAIIRELLRSISGKALFGKLPLIDEYIEKLHSSDSDGKKRGPGIKILRRGDEAEEDEE